MAPVRLMYAGLPAAERYIRDRDKALAAAEGGLRNDDGRGTAPGPFVFFATAG